MELEEVTDGVQHCEFWSTWDPCTREELDCRVKIVLNDEEIEGNCEDVRARFSGK